MHHTNPQVIRKPRSALATTAFGLSAFMVTTIVCVTSIVLYGMHILDRRSGGLLEFAQSSIGALPELAEALPPAIADVLSDRRDPGYAEQLDVSVHLAEVGGREGVLQPIVEVRNRGDQLVTLLSMRVVILDEDGRPVVERNEWAATPFAAEDCWRGPLMPGATRHLTAGYYRLRDAPDVPGDHVTVEITDVRVWEGGQTAAANSTASDVFNRLSRAGT